MLRKLARFGVPLLILAVSAGVAGYLKVTRSTISPTPPTERVWTVATQVATITNIRPEVRLFGEIVSGRTVDLRAEVAGKIVQATANLVEGGTVRAGEVVAHIDPFDYEAAVRQREAELVEARGRLRELEAQIEGARSLLKGDVEQVALRRRDVERRAQLKGSGAGTAKAADDAQLALSEAEQRRIDRAKEISRLEAVMDQQRAAIDRLEVALLRAKRDLSQSRIIAPFGGFLQSVETVEGKWVNTGDRVARLIDADRLEAKFYVSRGQFRRLMAGGGFEARPARVSWRGRADGRPYTAFIDRVGSEIDPATGGVNLYARIETGGTATVLRPGAFVEVQIADRVYERVVRLPATAVYDDTRIYVVRDGRLEAKSVDIVARVGGDVLIAGAVAEGDRIVTTRFPEIAPGLKVRMQ